MNIYSLEAQELETRFREEIEHRNASLVTLQDCLDELRMFPKDIDKIIIHSLYGDVGEINPCVAYNLIHRAYGTMYITIQYCFSEKMVIHYSHCFQNSSCSLQGFYVVNKCTLNVDEFWQFILNGDVDWIIKICSERWVRINYNHIQDSSLRFIDDFRYGLLVARDEILHPRVVDQSPDDDDEYSSEHSD